MVVQAKCKKAVILEDKNRGAPDLRKERDPGRSRKSLKGKISGAYSTFAGSILDMQLASVLHPRTSEVSEVPESSQAPRAVAFGEAMPNRCDGGKIRTKFAQQN